MIFTEASIDKEMGKIMKKISACTLDCQDTCSTIVRINNKENSVSITGNPDHPFTRGFICRKGRRTYQRITSSQRITTPLIKRGGSFHPTDWDSALNLVAEKISALRNTPASMLHVRHYGYRGAFSDGSKYLFNTLGASSTRGALCDGAGCTAFIEDFGGLEMNDPLDLINADHIINWGKDLSRSSIHLAGIVKRARKQGCRVTSISPGGDGNGAYSDFFIRIKPGSDRFLAAAVIKEILDRDLADTHAMSRASGLEPFMALIASQSMKTLLHACDCSQKDVEHLVSVFTEKKNPELTEKNNPEFIGKNSPEFIEKNSPELTEKNSPELTEKNNPELTEKNNPEFTEKMNLAPLVKQAVAVIMGWGIQRYHFGGENVSYINALSLLAGHVGRSGGGTYFSIPSNRNINSDWVSNAGKPARRLLLPRIGTDILNADPPIKFLLADGSNFVNQAPDAGTTIKAMEQIPFKVVIDAFMTDTAAHADVFLPCTLDYEREEIVGSCLHNWINYAAPVFPPSGKARCDFDIMSDLASRLDIPFPEKKEILEKTLDTPYMENPLQAIREIKEKGFVRASHPEIAWKNLKFAHPDGKYRLPAVLNRDPEAPNGFPMHLLSLVNRDFMHSQLPEEAQTDLLDVWISQNSPQLAQLDETKPVYIATPLGRMPVQVKYLENLHPQTLIIRRGGWLKHGRCVNILIEPAVTDMGESAAYYSQYARLENGSMAQQGKI